MSIFTVSADSAKIYWYPDYFLCQTSQTSWYEQILVVFLKFRLLDYLVSHIPIVGPLKSRFACKGYIFHTHNWKIEIFGFPVS